MCVCVCVCCACGGVYICAQCSLPMSNLFTLLPFQSAASKANKCHFLQLFVFSINSCNSIECTHNSQQLENTNFYLLFVSSFCRNEQFIQCRKMFCVNMQFGATQRKGNSIQSASQLTSQPTIKPPTRSPITDDVRAKNNRSMPPM